MSGFVACQPSAKEKCVVCARGARDGVEPYIGQQLCIPNLHDYRVVSVSPGKDTDGFFPMAGLMSFVQQLIKHFLQLL